jgi:hypothetical protein
MVYARNAVLPFLQSHDSYGVDECLRQCLRHRVQVGSRRPPHTASGPLAAGEDRLQIERSLSTEPVASLLLCYKAAHWPP